MRFRRSGGAGAVDQLRQVPLFEGVSDADLVHVAELAEPVDAEAGAVLMDQGAVGTECFLVLEGTAGIFHGDDHVATVGPGTIVGEMALIGHRPRNARVVAESAMGLLAFDIGAFKSLLDDLPTARDRIYGLLESRRDQNRELD